MENIIMKVGAIIIALVALHYMYRIACPKRETIQKDDKTPEKDAEPENSIVKKSHFVLPSLGQPQPTTATSTEFENTTVLHDIQLNPEDIPINWTAI